MDKIKDFFRTITEEELTPREIFLLLVTVFFGGILIGFMISPVKKGLAFCSHNGNGNYAATDANNVNKNDCCCEDCDCDEDCCCECDEKDCE